jgi:hypothetical protein
VSPRRDLIYRFAGTGRFQSQFVALFGGVASEIGRGLPDSRQQEASRETDGSRRGRLRHMSSGAVRG